VLSPRSPTETSSTGASSSDGLVIALSRYINYCRVDPDKKLAYVGGGALWRDVDNAAIEHGLATVGGTVQHVRVVAFSHLLVSHYCFFPTDRSRRVSATTGHSASSHSLSH
jgi:hypothetical protein